MNSKNNRTPKRDIFSWDESSYNYNSTPLICESSEPVKFIDENYNAYKSLSEYIFGKNPEYDIESQSYKQTCPRPSPILTASESKETQDLDDFMCSPGIEFQEKRFTESEKMGSIMCRPDLHTQLEEQRALANKLGAED
jgi:hypothetical protein